MMAPAYNIVGETETTDWPAISRNIRLKSSASSTHSIVCIHSRVNRTD